MPWNNARIMALLAGILLSGCTTVRYIAPPPELLQDCDIPTAQVRTNKDLAELANARKAALLRCNADKEALRAWANTRPE